MYIYIYISGWTQSLFGLPFGQRARARSRPRSRRAQCPPSRVRSWRRRPRPPVRKETGHTHKHNTRQEQRHTRPHEASPHITTIEGRPPVKKRCEEVWMRTAAMRWQVDTHRYTQHTDRSCNNGRSSGMSSRVRSWRRRPRLPVKRRLG